MTPVICFILLSLILFLIISALAMRWPIAIFNGENAPRPVFINALAACVFSLPIHFLCQWVFA